MPVERGAWARRCDDEGGVGRRTARTRTANRAATTRSRARDARAFRGGPSHRAVIEIECGWKLRSARRSSGTLLPGRGLDEKPSMVRGASFAALLPLAAMMLAATVLTPSSARGQDATIGVVIIAVDWPFRGALAITSSAYEEVLRTVMSESHS